MMSVKGIPCPRWSKEEEEILRKNAIDTPVAELKKLIPRRTIKAIQTKKERMGLRSDRFRPLDPCKINNGTATEEEKAYVAGFIDGDGALSVKDSHSLTPYIALFNTNLEVLEHIQKIVGGRISKQEHSRRSREGTLWVLRITSVRNVLNVLRNLQPYFVLKKNICTKMIEFCELMLERKSRSPATEKERMLLGEIKSLQREWLKFLA